MFQTNEEKIEALQSKIDQLEEIARVHDLRILSLQSDKKQLEAENAALRKTIDKIAAENTRVNDEAIALKERAAKTENAAKLLDGALEQIAQDGIIERQLQAQHAEDEKALRELAGLRSCTKRRARA
jgi:chromosome segregation ATPase